MWIFHWLPLFWWFWCWSLKIVWAPREIFLRCLSCSCDVTKVGGLLCNTSPLCKDGDDYIEDDNDVGDHDDENDADNCDHNVVTTIMVTIIMVAKIMVTMMMVVEMMTGTRITMMTMNSLLHFTLFCWKSCLFFAIYAVLWKIGLLQVTRYCVDKILAKNSIKVMFLWWWFLCVVFWLVQSEVFWLIQVMMMPMCGILTDTKRFDCYKWCFRMMMLILYTGTYASVLTDTKRFDWYNDDDAHTVHWDLWQTVS